MPAGAVYIDGVNATPYAQEVSVTHQANGKSTAAAKMPLDYAVGGHYSTLYVQPTGGLEPFWGRVHHVDEQGDESHPGYVILTAVDPSHILEYRPARDADGDFSKPNFMADFPQGPLMIQELLQNSLTYESDLGFTLGSFAAGGVSLAGLATDWPMSISEVIGQLVQTGEVDLVKTFSSSGMTLSAENGRAGSDVSGSVSFKYAMGSESNCSACRRTIDGSDIMNKLWLYLGPREGTKNDPAGDQHWAGNITRDHPELAGLPGNAGAHAFWASQVSRQQYLERMEVRILDADYDIAYQLYLHWWVRETLLRAQPKVLVHMTPEKGLAPSFRCHDRIHVQAGSSFRGGFSGVQRVYQYTYRWDHSGPIELGEPVGQAGAPAVITSADQEAVA
jgi:hypothetical protein